MEYIYLLYGVAIGAIVSCIVAFILVLRYHIGRQKRKIAIVSSREELENAIKDGVGTVWLSGHIDAYKREGEDILFRYDQSVEVYGLDAGDPEVKADGFIGKDCKVGDLTCFVVLDGRYGAWVLTDKVKGVTNETNETNETNGMVCDGELS